MKQLKFLLLSAVLLLSSCVTNNSSSTSNSSTSTTSNDTTSESSSETSSSTSSETSTSDTSSSTSEIPTTKIQHFSHKFERNDFTQAGGEYDINGCHWIVDPFTFYGAGADGIQIGSKNNPQKTPWTMKTSFDEEVTLLSYSLMLKNANGGGGTINISASTYNDNHVFSTTTLTEFGDVEINQTITDFSLTLQSTGSAAIYLYSLSFSIETAYDSKLEITEDIYNPVPVEPGKNGIPNINYQPTTLEEYYIGIDFNKDGSTLLIDLRNKISNMTKTSYSDAKTMLLYADENPKTPGYLYGLYDGDDIKPIWDSGSSWNREHVWACSQMNLTGTVRPDESTRNHTSDLHNLRVACTAGNGFHGNKFYDETNSNLALYPNLTHDDIGGVHKFVGDHRGDVARILFYMYTRYEGLVLDDLLDPTNDVSMGKLSVLIKWHELDPVDEFEVQRNNRIYAYQGNRNPYIDHPELVNKIF